MFTRPIRHLPDPAQSCRPQVEFLENRQFVTSVADFSVNVDGSWVPLEQNQVLEFGSTPYGLRPTFEIQVENVGDDELVTRSIQWPDQFRISKSVQRVLAPGESSTFAIQFDSFTLGATGERQVTVRTNDPNRMTFAFFVSAERTFEQSGVEGDFTNDGLVDVSDLDVLQDVLAAGDVDEFFDLTKDGAVNTDDLAYLVEELLGTVAGDTDLDGDVDFGDFLTLSGNFGNAPATWADGNFDANTSVDFADFLALSGNFGFQA